MTKGRRWSLVATTGVLTGFGHGFAAFAVSALLKPVAVDLDTGRGAISIAVGLGRLFGGLASPSIGRATDNYGSRRVVIGGMLVAVFGLLCLAFVQNTWQLYLAWSVVFSLGVSTGFTVALDKLVVVAMGGKPGMGLAVRFSISAVVSTLIVPIVATMIATWGWRVTCLIWAGVVLAMIPAPWFFFDRHIPSPPKTAAEKAKDDSQPHLLRSISFWLIALALAAQAGVTTGLSVHMVAMLTDAGLDAVVAGSLFGAMILMSVPVRVLAGYIADRAKPHQLPMLLGGLLVAEGMVMGLFAIWPGVPSMLGVILALGIAAGAPLLISLVLCSVLFGQTRFGEVQGWLMMFQVPGATLAPIVAGYAFDFTGTYVPVVGAFAIALILGGSLLFRLRAHM